MSTKYKFHNSEAVYFVSFSVINWVDVFVRREYKDALLDSFRYCQQQKGLVINAWCIMTSHVHLLVATKEKPLQDIMRDLKRHTSNQLRQLINSNPIESRKEWMVRMMVREGVWNPNNIDWQFWQQDNHPIEILNGDMLKQKLDYIHHNPVEAGFVAQPQDYLYSSAADYAGLPGLLPIEVLDYVAWY